MNHVKPTFSSKPPEKGNPGKTDRAEVATADVTDEEEDEEEERIPHPNVGSENKKLYPFTVTRGAVTVEGQEFPAQVGNFPKDYDNSTHERLKKNDFATPADYAFYQMQAAEERLNNAKERFHNALLGKKGMSDEKRFAKMFARIQELRKKLVSRGVNVDELVGDDDTE